MLNQQLLMTAKEKKFILGQYFTKNEVVNRLIELLQKYKKYNKHINILEPSAGTRNFVTALKNNGFNTVEECEIDEQLTKYPRDFLLFDLENKFDLIIGNPPFTKYNLKNSYYHPERYITESIPPSQYLTHSLLKKEKTKIENVFILKSIKHIKDKNSSIGFVLPISFFIGNKNKEVKKIISENFSTIIIYQNDKTWFEEPIPCCFAIFTNLVEYQDKIILIYENDKTAEIILDKDLLHSEELIPNSYLYKNAAVQEGALLSNFLSDEKVKYQRDYHKNNVSGANILERTKIPERKLAEEYTLAVVRVGNSSVGRAGLININEDILNDMFYVFNFKEEIAKDKLLKEKICELINDEANHLKNLTIRVGSKSIKKSDIWNLKIKI